MSVLFAVAAFEGTTLGEQSGAGLLLYATTASTDSEVQHLDDQVEVVIRAGSRAIIVRNLGNLADYESTLDHGVEAAQIGLDLLCARGKAVLELGDVAGEHLAWWHDSSGVAARLVVESTMHIRMGTTSVLVNGVPPTPTPQRWHPSQRYFRRSQATHDLFDAFRNLYLALESILTTRTPQQPGEGEGRWLRRALSAADGVLPGGLAPFATPGCADPVTDVFNELHTQTRNPIFHAKQGRPSLLPATQSGAIVVQPALERLGELYLALLQAELGLRFHRGIMTRAGFRLAYDNMPISRFHLSNTGAPFDPNALDVPSDSVSLAAQRAPVLDTAWSVAFRALATADELAELPILRTVFAADDNTPYFAYDLEGALEISGLTSVECCLAFRGENTRVLRTRYAT